MIKALLRVTCIVVVLSFSSHFAFTQIPKQPREADYLEEISCRLATSTLFEKPDKFKNSPAQTIQNELPIRKSSSFNRQEAACDIKNLAELSTLSPAVLITYLKSIESLKCAPRSLYDYESTYSPVIFQNSSIQVVAQEIIDQHDMYDGTSSSGLFGLLYYLHAATFHESNETEIKLDESSRALLAKAMMLLSQNTHLFDISEYALITMAEYIILLDNPGIRHQQETIDIVKAVMANWSSTKTWKSIPPDLLFIFNYANTYNGIFFLMFRGIANGDEQYQQAIENDTEFFALLYAIASDEELMNDKYFSFIVSNALLELTRMTDVPNLIVPNLNSIVQPYLGQLLEDDLYERLSLEWLSVVIAIQSYGDCTLWNICHESEEDLRNELNDLLFPNTFSFDDGKMIVKTPLSLEEVQPLYHAAKQVQAQFFRLLQSDIPLPGDTNETLTMVIYGSPQEYNEYQYFLNQLDTDNGGIYIEEGATFYTFERTPQESSFSLKELFRHEYVHYLVGRYIVNGSWGQTEFYENNRFTWFDEGIAEFLSGSRDAEGIALRKSVLNGIASDGADRLTISDVIGIGYESGFTFYSYSGLLWSYWYENDKSVYKQLFDLIISDDISNYARKLLELKGDEDLQQAYDAYLDEKIAANDSWVPVTEWSAEHALIADQTETIEESFIEITENSAVVSLEANSLNKRFMLTGTIAGNEPIMNDNTQASIVLDQALNDMLIKLREESHINNFQYAIGYFANITFNGDLPSADFVITGPLRQGDMIVPITNFYSDRNLQTTGGTINFYDNTQNTAIDAHWTFEGGESAESTELNPTVLYETLGLYKVTLETSNLAGASKILKSDYVQIVSHGFTADYCTTTNTSEDLYINSVELGYISNASEWENYSLKDSWFTPIAVGESYPLKINTNYFDQGYDHTLGVWVDWNQDSDFNDPDETIFNKAQTSGSVKTIVSPPADALNGFTRIRIRINAWSDASEPCGDDEGRGEVEDYLIYVQNGALAINDAIGALAINDAIEGIKVYPNPTNDYFIIKSNEVLSIQLFDLTGKLIKQDLFPHGKLDVRQLNPGVYVLEISNGDKITRKRVVKAN